jgi:hypothetical protein
METSLWTGKKSLWAGIFIIGIGVAYVMIFKYFTFSPLSTSSISTSTPPVAEISTSTDYGLYSSLHDEYGGEGWTPKIWYQDVGTVESGPYAGWKRIVGFKEADDPSGGSQNLFITQDGKTFLVDDAYYSQGNSANYNPARVTGTAVIPHPFPEIITLGGVTLMRGEFLQKDDFLKRTGSKIGTVGGFILTEENLDEYHTATSTQPYISASTNIFAENAIGNVVRYKTVTTSAYLEAKKEQEKSGTPYLFADFLLKKGTDYDLDGYMSQYADYFQVGCSHSGAVLNPQTVSSLKHIGVTKTGEELFVFTDPAYPLVGNFYTTKIKYAYDQYVKGENWYLYSIDTGNDVVKPPSLDEYTKNAPVIVFKDSLGRYIVLGEYYYGLAGGCGKPVIYLYPEKTTNISIIFKNAVSFMVDIPKYIHGWHVLAHPDGRLEDLQKEETPCRLIDTSRRGSEYAKEACKNNSYPYLYWEGNTVGDYPVLKEGWIVKREDLEMVMDKKLTELSLTPQERKEMLSYWVDEMKKTGAPYYRISFVQTPDMNTFIPMEVTPRPDTTIRVFLDWEPMYSEIQIEPQKLRGTTRKGFTLVEWGGLKR